MDYAHSWFTKYAISMPGWESCVQACWRYLTPEVQPSYPSGVCDTRIPLAAASLRVCYAAYSYPGLFSGYWSTRNYPCKVGPCCAQPVNNLRVLLVRTPLPPSTGILPFSGIKLGGVGVRGNQTYTRQQQKRNQQLASVSHERSSVGQWTLGEKKATGIQVNEFCVFRLKKKIQLLRFSRILHYCLQKHTFSF